METTNPYAPPSADLTKPAAGTATPPFYPVATAKFVVMCIATFGLYEIYWLYKNWQAVRDREQTNISPFWRAVFGVFFIYSLFKKVREQGAATLAAGPLATGWIIFNFLAQLPEPWWLVSLLGFLFLLPAVQAMQQINAAAAPDHDRNNIFTAWNIVGIVVGAIMFVFMLIGLMLGDS